MLKRCFTYLGMLAVLLAAAPLSAGTVASTIFPNTLNDAQDIDAETLLKGSGNNGGTTVQVGDYLLAIVRIDAMQQVNPLATHDLLSTNNEMSGISLIRVAGIQASGSIGGAAMSTFEMAAPTAAQWNAALQAVGLTAAQAAAITPGNDNTTIQLFDGGPVHDWSRTTSPLSASILTSTNGSLMWDAGFTTGGTGSLDPTTGNPTLNGSGEGWTAFAPSDISNIATNRLARNSSSFDTALNVIVTGPGAFGTVLGPATLADGTTNFGVETQFQTHGGFDAAGSGPFGVWTHSDTYFQPIPEPGSIVMWAGLTVLAGVVSYRRKKA